MKNTLSSHYLLRRYSYWLYFLACGIFLLRLKSKAWILQADDVEIFAIISLFYFLWIFVYGTFHFREQAKVSRMDYNTLKFTKGGKNVEITKSDISKIYVQEIKWARTMRKWYKILLLAKDGEKFRFTYISGLSNSSKTGGVKDFLYITEDFWGLADNEMILESPDVFFGN